jgi:hypothetical protein
MSPREQVALTINVSLKRLPLVLEILEEIHEAEKPGFPGDDDLHHGSIRAVQTMADRLGKIEPAPQATMGEPTTAEEIAGEWLLGDRPRRLIPPSLLDQLAESISRLLPRPTVSLDMKRNGHAS